MLEPLSVAIHSTRRASIEQGDTVIVFGAGTVGLLVAAMAKLSGATTVMIADINAGRVKYALDNKFATRGYIVPHAGHSGHNGHANGHAEKSADQFEEAKTLASDVVDRACAGETDFEGADVTFDCTGKEVCMQAGLYVSVHLEQTKVFKLIVLRQRDLVVSSSWSAWAPLSRHCKCQQRILRK